jgi:DNA modification methylase
MNVEQIPIKDITPYAENAKKHDETQIKNVMESIRQFGFAQPLVLDKDGTVIIGHCRLIAAKRLHMSEVPCVRMDELTEEQAQKLRLLDNKLNESDWDFELLADQIPDLDFSEFDIDWGIPELDEEPEQEEEKQVVEDEIPDDAEVEARVKAGDIWRLGEHLLICGDSTDRRTLEKLMGEERADMVFTDPPYGMGKEKEGVLNDNLNFDDLLEFNKLWIPLSFDYTKENGSWYCWGIDEPLMDIYSAILRPMQKDSKITFRNIITWDKGHGFGQLSEGYRMYPIADEKCLFVMCGVQGFNNNADNYYEGWEPIRKYLADGKAKMGWNDADIQRITGVTTVARHCFGKSQWEFITEEHYNELREAARVQGEQVAFEKDFKAFNKEYQVLKKEYDELKKEYYSTRAYFDNTHDNMNNVWHFERTSQKERELTGGHATPKPIVLCARAIKSSSMKDGVVLDLFGGSGSTLIACEQLGRKCRMIELDEHYCDVILRRWEVLSGKTAEKIQ